MSRKALRLHTQRLMLSFATMSLHMLSLHPAYESLVIRETQNIYTQRCAGQGEGGGVSMDLGVRLKLEVQIISSYWVKKGRIRGTRGAVRRTLEQKA